MCFGTKLSSLGTDNLVSSIVHSLFLICNKNTMCCSNSFFIIIITGSNGKYWNVCEDGTITVDSDIRQGFFIELREPSKLCIKTARGSYVMAEKNGTFKVNGADFDTATSWEY